jgi:hypothetical protein
MSDVQNGPDWWQGVDGKWYPPVAPIAASSSVPPPPPSFTTPSPEVAAPAPDSKKRTAIIASVAAVVIVVTVLAIALTAGGTSTKSVVGTFKLIDSSQCDPDGGYGDINSSTPVVLKGKDGKELARTELGNGVEDSGYPLSCTWAFTLKVPKGQEYYVLSVGNRGEMKYTWNEITQPFAIGLTLGD